MPSSQLSLSLSLYTAIYIYISTSAIYIYVYIHAFLSASFSTLLLPFLFLPLMTRRKKEIYLSPFPPSHPPLQVPPPQPSLYIGRHSHQLPRLGLIQKFLIICIQIHAIIIFRETASFQETRKSAESSISCSFPKVHVVLPTLQPARNRIRK